MTAVRLGSLEEWDHWFTPAHVMGGWTFKLKPEADAAPVLYEMPKPDPVAPDIEQSPAPGGQLSLF